MSSHSLKQFQILAVEIAEIGGESLLWQAHLTPGEKNESLAQALLAQVVSVHSQSL